MDEAVRAADLRVVRNRVAILHDVSLNIRVGETVAVVGPNGAGKSTLLKCFTGAICPDRGELCWFGESPTCSSEVRRKVGFAGHEHGLYGELSTLENLVFAARMFGIDDPQKYSDDALAAASLAHLSKTRVALLSQGLRQRVAIIRSTIHAPLLILLDEPFASLDSQGRDWLDSLFEMWRRSGQAVCFVSHDPDHSRELADRVITLDRGRLVDVEEKHACIPVTRRSA